MGPGDIIGGRYRLDRLLGEGGMGVVWAATHQVTHKTLALKFIHTKNDDPSSHKRALREARAACAVQHPNVVTIHDVLEIDGGTPVLVMDLLRGESLATRLERERTIPVDDAVRYARDVLSALEVAHTVGIVHRDLKPDNVFLLEGGALKILDFGVAKLRGQDAATKETNRLTETGAMIGTPHYMAPEQAFAEGEIDLRADLWAVGAILYECLAGVPPTDGANLGQILKALAMGNITPLALRVPTVPPPVLRLVDNLLQIDREKRPASATAVIAMIDAAREGGLPRETLPVTGGARPSNAGRPETPAPATRDATPSIPPRKSRTGAVFAAVGIALVLLVGGGVTTWRITAKRAAASAATAPIAIASEPVSAAPPPPASPPPAAASAILAASSETAPAASAPLTKKTKAGRPAAGAAKTTGADKPADAPKPGAGGSNPLLPNAPF